MNLHLKQGYYKDIRACEEIAKDSVLYERYFANDYRTMSVLIFRMTGRDASILQRPQKGKGPDSWSSAGMALRMSTIIWRSCV